MNTYYEGQTINSIVWYMNLIEDKYRQQYIEEADNIEFDKHWHIRGPLDPDAKVKANNLKEVTDSIHFIRDGVPNPNGLLSNEIFGITKDERANTMAYIDLHGWFLDPLTYIIWSRMDRRIKDIVHGTKRFIINDHGDFEENANGENGVEFLRKNIDKIKIRNTESKKRDKNIQYIEKFKKKIFIRKLLVLPAYYRDVNTSGGNVGVGILNKYYAQLIINVKALTETADYGLPTSAAVKGKVQETIVQIYNCLCGTSGAEVDGIGLSKKKGLVRTAVMSKTTDYGTRLVITAPELKVERLEDIMADLQHCGLPLASACANFKPFVIFYIKQFFENEFGGGVKHQVIDKNGKVVYENIQDPLIQFSEDVIVKEIDRFIHGYSNRLRPVTVTLESGKQAYMIFKGHHTTAEKVAKGDVYGESSLINRRLTWCDILFMATNEACKERHVLLTRFPIDSMYSQIPQKVRITTLNDTEKIYINGEYYPWYPKIRESDINTNTSNMFIDTLQVNNLLIIAMGGDYDGDQFSVKAIFTDEANAENDKYLNSKAFYLGINGNNVRTANIDPIQVIYCMTKVLKPDEKELTKTVKMG